MKAENETDQPVDYGQGGGGGGGGLVDGDLFAAGGCTGTLEPHTSDTWSPCGTPPYTIAFRISGSTAEPCIRGNLANANATVTLTSISEQNGHTMCKISVTP